MLKLKFALVLVITFVISRVLIDTSSSITMFALVTLPGTFLHELAYYMAAALLGGSPSNFNLIPSGNTLGSVMFAPNWYNAATVGVAPALLAPLTAFFAALAARTRNIITTLGMTYLAACSWVACTPSSADISIALGAPTSWLPAIIILSIATWAVYKVVRRMVQ